MAAERRAQWDVLAVIAAGGVVGGLLRKGVSSVVGVEPGGFPWGTFAENVAGSLALAVVMVLAVEVGRPHRYVRPFLGIGVLGSFTTFSAMTSEVRALTLDGASALAFGYVVATLVAGLAAMWGGLRVTRWVVGARAAGAGRSREQEEAS